MSIIEELRSKFQEEELVQKIAHKKKEYHNLITDESAEYLLALEIIGPKAQIQHIEAAKLKQLPCILNAKVLRIFMPQIFTKNGMESRTQRIEIQDASGDSIVACFDEESKKVDEEVLSGDLVEIGPARYRGSEFHLQKNGVIKRIQKGKRDKLEGATFGNFEGEITYFFGDFPYKRGQSKLSGEAPTELMSTFEVDDGSKKVRAIKWDSKGLSGILKKGMQVEIENGVIRNSEIHIGKSARLVFVKEKEDLPQIEKIEIDEQKVNVVAGEYRASFDSLELAAQKFGIRQVPQGISPKTAIELKKDYWIGRNIPKKWIK